MKRVRQLAAVILACVLTEAPICQASSVKPKDAIQHIVVIFQENVSFDHYFAPYPNALNPEGEPKFTA